MNRIINPIGQTVILTLALMFVMVLSLSCSDDSGPTEPGDTNTAPAAPAINMVAGAPGDDATNVSVAADLHWTCADPDGDVLTYTVHFGETASPPVVATDQAPTTHALATLEYSTTYTWKIVAKDPDGATKSSPIWTFTTIAAMALETVSAPSAPTGPAAGYLSMSLDFTAGGAFSSYGNPLLYRMDWGDGVVSDWSNATAFSHSWSTVGNYDVTTQARSSVQPYVESAWSAVTAVDITEPSESIYMGFNFGGPLTVGQGEVNTYDISRLPTSSEGHAIEIQFDWGDGTSSDWSTSLTATHAWSAIGSYNVGVRARCAVHTAITAERDLVGSVEVSPAETVSLPTGISNLSDEEYSSIPTVIRPWGSVNSFGHDVEYQMDFGDGTESEWLAEGINFSHTWAWGTYDIRARARCVEHNDIVSEWYGPETSTFIEFFTSSPELTVPAAGVVGQAVPVSTTAVVTIEGHAIEYSFRYWDRDAVEWVGTDFSPSTTGSITFVATGSFEVQVVARCAEHTDVFRYSDRHDIVISAP